MLKKSKIISISLISIVIVSFIISVITDNEDIFFIPLLIVIIFKILTTTIESKIISKHYLKLIEIKDYEAAIDYLLNKIKDSIILKVANNCLISLVITYMMNNNTLKAKELISKYKKLRKSKDIIFIRIILLIDESRIQEARSLNSRLQLLSNQKYNGQKRSALGIFEMIERNKFNVYIYKSTNFPLLKEICLKYKGDFTDEAIQNIDGHYKEVKMPIKKSTKLIKFISVILNILTIISIFLAQITIASIMFKKPTLISLEGFYNFLSSIKYIFLFLPIPITSIFYGIVFRKKGYKTSSNIISGVIIAILLTMFGSMFLLRFFIFSTSTNYISRIEEVVDVNIPDNVTIITQNWTRGTQTTSDNNYYKYESVIRFKDNISVNEFKYEITTNNNWNNTLTSEIKSFIPTMYRLTTEDFDYFVLYCLESNTYNHVEDISGRTYIYMAYDESNEVLLICEFRRK